MKHEIYPMRASEDGELLPAVVVDVPDVLYLQVVDTDDCEDWPAPSEPDERTFCYERINESDVAYVPLARAERAEARVAELETEIVLLRGAIAAQDERNLAATERVGLSLGGCDTPDDLAEEILALRAELEAARAGQEWRPVTEPPTDNGDYLVWVKYPKEPGFHSVARWTQRFKWENNFVHPTYWQPLPAAPGDGGEEVK